MMTYKTVLLYIILTLITITTTIMIIFFCKEIYNKNFKRKNTIIYSVNSLQIPACITIETKVVEFI